MDSGIYRPPESNLDEYESGHQGWGSVERALRGDFEFDPISIFNDARELLSGSKRVILLGVVIQGMVGVMAQRTIDQTFGQPEELQDMVMPSLLQMGPTVITAPITAGLLLFAIKRAVGDRSASFNEILSYYDRFLPIAGLTILQSLLIGLGFLFFILPGIYLALAYGLAMPLLVEKRMGVWEALETSRKALTHCWFRIFGFWLMAAIGAAIGIVLTLGIGLIWIMPLIFLCVGVMYRNIFGVEGVSETRQG